MKKKRFLFFSLSIPFMVEKLTYKSCFQNDKEKVESIHFDTFFSNKKLGKKQEQSIR